jgi:hypothetical protein
LPILILSMLLTQSALAEKFRYNYTQDDTLNYSLSADGQLDLSKVAAMAAMLQLSNLSENIFLNTELSAISVTKDGDAAIRAVNKKLSVVMIKNDSLRKVDNADLGYLKPGTTFNFKINPEGKITPVSGKGGYTDKSILGIWQTLLPAFPSQSIESGHRWVDSASYQAGYSGTTPVNVVCQINYTYIGADRFDYIIEGKSPQNASLHLAGNGYFTFDKKRGRLITNTCDLELKGFIDVTQFGLPKDLAANLPLAIKAQVIFKLLDEN